MHMKKIQGTLRVTGCKDSRRMENLITRGGSWVWTEIPSSSEQGLTLLAETGG